jgi:hypothetical protein
MNLDCSGNRTKGRKLANGRILRQRLHRAKLQVTDEDHAHRFGLGGHDHDPFGYRRIDLTRVRQHRDEVATQLTVGP